MGSSLSKIADDEASYEELIKRTKVQMELGDAYSKDYGYLEEAVSFGYSGFLAEHYVLAQRKIQRLEDQITEVHNDFDELVKLSNKLQT